MASGRMLSKKEVQHRLTKKGATEEQAADTADWLETLGAVDDEGYAGVIVRHYGAMGYGPGRVSGGDVAGMERDKHVNVLAVEHIARNISHDEVKI